MFHLVAFKGTAVDNTGLKAHAPLTDRFVLAETDGFIFAQDRDMLWVHARGATIQRARITAATLREITYPWIHPLQGQMATLVQPMLADYRENPFRLRALEKVNIESISGVAAPGEPHYVLMGVRWENRPAPRGQLYLLRGTTAQNVPVDAWTLGAITWQDTLPQGVYAVVGMIASGAGLLAARLVFDEQSYNPGTLAVNDVEHRTCGLFRQGSLGEWGRFRTFREPQVEFLAHTAGVPTEVFLEIIRVG